MLTQIHGYLKDEQGAEMVEWVVVVVVLATLAATVVFGPNGVVTDGVRTGINKIATIITTVTTL